MDKPRTPGSYQGALTQLAWARLPCCAPKYSKGAKKVPVALSGLLSPGSLTGTKHTSEASSLAAEGTSGCWAVRSLVPDLEEDGHLRSTRAPALAAGLDVSSSAWLTVSKLIWL
jgi:hypothetical protein